MLNLMGGGDVSILKYEEICDLCIRHSRNASRSGRGTIYAVNRTMKTSREDVLRMDIGNLPEDFKSDILSSPSSQLDALQMKKIQ